MRARTTRACWPFR